MEVKCKIRRVIDRLCYSCPQRVDGDCRAIEVPKNVRERSKRRSPVLFCTSLIAQVIRDFPN